MKRRTPLVLLSLAVHAAFAVGIGQIEIKKSHAATAIEYAETKKKKPPEPAKIDPTPQKPDRAPIARRAAAPAPADTLPPSKAAASSALGNAPDFGLSLSGTGSGVALPSGGGALPGGGGPRTVHQLVAVAKPSVGLDECSEPPTKPRPRGAILQPAFTPEALAAGVLGKVRVQLTVDETGRVVEVKLLQGLGYGLDEAALAAARQASFEPALHCGKPARGVVHLAFSFSR